MLKINGVNYDTYIVENKYSVNEVDEYGGTEYRDGWWKRHRTIVRHSVNGTVTLAFPSASAYNDFVDHMRANTHPEGVYSVEVYVNNLNQTKNIWAFLTVTTKTAIATKNYEHAPVFFSVTIKIEEQ